ncbi:hypothetical protein, secreted [gut metagenome]|uniref:Uncharacterized protein n=1 Tax=gut metagenome TaxID=749906 RepID=J9H717_9ZZZZ
MNPKLTQWLICFLTILLPTCLQAQEDKQPTDKGLSQSILMRDFLFHPTGTVSFNSALPTVLSPPTKPTIPPPILPVLPTVHFTLPKQPVIPYYTNPAPLFKGDFHTDGILLSHRFGNLSASGSQTSVPGIGRFNEASLVYLHRLNDKLSFQLSMDAIKMNMNHLNGQALSTSGMMLYQASDKLGFRVFSSYAPGNTFGMKTHNYGGTMIWQISDRFGLEMGAERYYDSMRGGWQTVPVVIPSYRFDKFKLELDVGGILYEILRGILDTKKGYDTRGATITPPHFNFPAK